MSTLAIALAAHLDKTNPEDTKPNITPETVIETKRIEGKFCVTKECIKDQATIALAMLETGGKPVMNIERYPALAGEIPQKYFDKVKEGFFGEEGAKQYKKYAEYFSSLVVEGKEGYISGYLLAVFNNPGKESTYQRFLKKLNKKLKPGKTIDENKITEMLSILDEMGIRLKTVLDSQELELSKKRERIKELNKSIEEGLKKKAKWEEEKRGWEEEDRKWEEEKRGWEKKKRGWEEEDRRREEEDKRRREEEDRKWEEEKRGWEEEKSRREEEDRKWEEEEKRRREEEDRKWEEEKRRREEFLKQREEYKKQREKNMKKLDADIKRLDGVIGKRKDRLEKVGG